MDRQDAKCRGDTARAPALALAGLLLALATACGAFGAHALKGRLPPERLQLWETAVHYHFFQALGLLGIGLTLRLLEQRGAVAPGALRGAAVLSAIGAVLFSGSLYALALGAARGLGVLTPLGGIAWIAAWLLFAWGAWRAQF
ncbi:MAG TPA: DUF423 domain-containing protein [Steroidobacteraceae bacterium]|jgi:uncharacterized membrane protein YgdD (TMEM256/DUF423 family)|nr:DUF423 domain-containing protein [Steroidobacteraceae bacterium]